MNSCECRVRASAVPVFPKIINIEVLRGVCPCSCVHCPVGSTPADDRVKRFGNRTMSSFLFRKIAHEVVKYPGTCIRFHAAGEPLLWKGLPDALLLTKALGIGSWVFTSAVTRNTQILESLCDSADIIEVSVNSCNPRDYRQSKGIDAWNLVHDNIIFLSKRIKAKKLHTRLVLSRVDSFDKAADAAFLKYWQGTGMAADVFIRSYHSYNGLLEGPPSEIWRMKKQFRPPCLVHWGRFNISYSGKVPVCFNELFKQEVSEDVILGDLEKETIYSIWHGPKLNAIRTAEESGDYSRLSENIPCRSCTTCQPLQADTPTSESQLAELATC